MKKKCTRIIRRGIRESVPSRVSLIFGHFVAWHVGVNIATDRKLCRGVAGVTVQLISRTRQGKRRSLLCFVSYYRDKIEVKIAESHCRYPQIIWIRPQIIWIRSQIIWIRLSNEIFLLKKKTLIKKNQKTEAVSFWSVLIGLYDIY